MEEWARPHSWRDISPVNSRRNMSVSDHFEVQHRFTICSWNFIVANAHPTLLFCCQLSLQPPWSILWSFTPVAALFSSTSGTLLAKKNSADSEMDTSKLLVELVDPKAVDIKMPTLCISNHCPLLTLSFSLCTHPTHSNTQTHTRQQQHSGPVRDHHVRRYLENHLQERAQLVQVSGVTLHYVMCWGNVTLHYVMGNCVTLR